MAVTKLKKQGIEDFVLSSFIERNGILDGGCQISQVVTTQTLTTSYKYGYNDLFLMKGSGTAISAGSSSTATPTVASTKTSKCDSITGVTITGTGIVFGARRIEAIDALKYKNRTVSVAVTVGHNVGSAINYQINLYKPTVSDNYASRTLISSSSAISVVSGVSTLIEFKNVSAGDVTNGLEFEVQASCGAITTKSFEFGDWQLNPGVEALPFSSEDFTSSLLQVKRHYRKSYDIGIAPGANSIIGQLQFNVGSSVVGNIGITVPFEVVMRTTPVATVYAPAGTANVHLRSAGTSAATTSVDQCKLFTYSATGTGTDFIAFQYAADARITP